MTVAEEPKIMNGVRALEERLITDPQEIQKITGIAGIRQIRTEDIRGGEWQLITRNVAMEQFGRIGYVDDVTYMPNNTSRKQVGFIAKAGSGVLPVDTEGNLYFAKVFAYHGQFHGTFIAGGGIKPGETPEQCGRRETEEELGLKFKKMINLGTFVPIPGVIE